MKNSVILILKGLIIGFAKIIPGVSGAMLAISLNVYEKSIEIIGNFFNDLFNNIKFLSYLGFGILISIVLGSNIINYCFNNFYLPTMLLFLGLIIGGIREITDKTVKSKKNIIAFIVSFCFVFLLTLINKNQEDVVFSYNLSTFLLLFLLGIIEATTMVIPGISGTAIMLILGCYRPILMMWSNILNLNNIVLLIPFMIGVLLGVIVLAKLMNYLFKNHNSLTYSLILGFSFSSILILLLQTLQYNYKIMELIIGFILLILGYKISSCLDRIGVANDK